jgi:hypothetical protein
LLLLCSKPEYQYFTTYQIFILDQNPHITCISLASQIDPSSYNHITITIHSIHSAPPVLPATFACIHCSLKSILSAFAFAVSLSSTHLQIALPSQHPLLLHLLAQLRIILWGNWDIPIASFERPHRAAFQLVCLIEKPLLRGLSILPSSKTSPINQISVKITSHNLLYFTIGLAYSPPFFEVFHLVTLHIHYPLKYVFHAQTASKD